jgi:hypothetical protein
MHDMNPTAACPEGRPLRVRTIRPTGDRRSGPRHGLPRDRMTPTIRVMYPADNDLTPKADEDRRCDHADRGRPTQ